MIYWKIRMEWISWHTTENASWFFVLHLRNICCTIQSWGGEANGKGRRGQTRRDSKRRVLRPGESVRADGKYQYKHHIDRKPHFVYSWKLELTDKLPKGKKPCFVTQKIGEAGQYGFGFAGKYRGRVSFWGVGLRVWNNSSQLCDHLVGRRESVKESGEVHRWI